MGCRNTTAPDASSHGQSRAGPLAGDGVTHQVKPPCHPSVGVDRILLNLAEQILLKAVTLLLCARPSGVLDQTERPVGRT